MLKAKIHRATITRTDINYTGSITIDKKLLIALDILPYERVQVVNINNGSRLETYVIEGAADSGVIELNGAAARLAVPGDKVIIIAYEYLDKVEARSVKPRLALLGDDNKIIEMLDA